MSGIAYTSTLNGAQVDRGVKLGTSSYVPTLQSAPTSSTLTFTLDDDTINFRIGMLCRVADQTQDSGYKFYRLHNLETSNNATTATWKEEMNTTPKTTIETTDSIVLKGTDGLYYTIARDSFMETVRDALGSLLVDKDKMSISRVIATDSSNDLGSMTIANLRTTVNALTSKTRPANVTDVDLFTFTLTSSDSNSKFVLQMGVYFTNYKDILHCDLSFVSTNSSNVAYGFTQHLQGRTGGNYTSSVKLYLEKDSSNSKMYHVKAKFSYAAASPIWFYIKAINEATVAYKMTSTTIAGDATLLGTTSV